MWRGSLLDHVHTCCSAYFHNLFGKPLFLKFLLHKLLDLKDMLALTIYYQMMDMNSILLH